MLEDFLEQLQRIEALDGTTHKSSESKVRWHKFVKPYPTREEAIHAANSDALKKHKSLVPIEGLSNEEVVHKAVDKYVDDLIKRLING